ncbi:glycosyltransferase [bacterium]|nr:glycosyltransferase [bacterium]
MRILHVGKFYAPVKGGMETSLRHQVEGLLDAGHDVRVLVAAAGRRTRRDDLPGAPGALVRVGAAGTWNSQPLTLGLPRALGHQLSGFRPEIVHLHTPNPLACWAWRRQRTLAATVGARLAVWHHSDIVRQRLTRRVIEPVVRRCLDDAAGICVSSAHLRESSRQLAVVRDRVAVIPFGIDPRPFARPPTGDGPFLFVGRLVPYKGLATLLAAVAATPGARLDIVGSGPLRQALARRIADARLADRVRLLGEVPDEVLPEMLAACRALVLPSRDQSETFGLILLEAMAAARPVIASDLPTGVRDLARPGETGWLAPPGDEGALADALASCLADPAEADRRGRRGRALVEKQYTRARLATRLLTWYEELLARETGGELANAHGVKDVDRSASRPGDGPGN